MSHPSDPFRDWFVDAMARIRVVWPWFNFVVFTRSLIIISLSELPKPPRHANDNTRLRRH